MCIDRLYGIDMYVDGYNNNIIIVWIVRESGDRFKVCVICLDFGIGWLWLIDWE